jgi:hypothetical protein
MAKKKEIEIAVEEIQEAFVDESAPEAESEFDYDVPLPSRAFGRSGGPKAANEALIRYLMEMPVGASKLIPLEGRDIKIVKTAIGTALRRTAEVSHTEDGKRHILRTRRYHVAPDAKVEGAARVWHIAIES